MTDWLIETLHSYYNVLYDKKAHTKNCKPTHLQYLNAISTSTAPISQWCRKYNRKTFPVIKQPLSSLLFAHHVFDIQFNALMFCNIYMAITEIYPDKIYQNYHSPLYLQLCGSAVQEAQLPQRNSASAAHMEGANPYSPLPLPPLATPMRTVESENRNKRTSSVPSVKRTLSWIGHSRSSLFVPTGTQSGVLS